MNPHAPTSETQCFFKMIPKKAESAGFNNQHIEKPKLNKV